MAPAARSARPADILDALEPGNRGGARSFAADPVRIVPASEGLASIADPACALAIWQRPVPQRLEELVAGIDLAALCDIRLKGTLPLRPARLAARIAAAGVAELAARALAKDIAALAALHGRLAGADRVRIRLEMVETDACRKFHADYVTMRLITTYRGAGTQWCRADAPDTCAALAPGDVGLFKGRLLLDPPSVLHRSPPIAASGAKRLLLVIDPVFEEPAAVLV